jgi:hypothetical protein
VLLQFCDDQNQYSNLKTMHSKKTSNRMHGAPAAIAAAGVLLYFSWDPAVGISAVAAACTPLLKTHTTTCNA